MKITKIEYYKDEKEVYDIQTKNANFYASSAGIPILVHNSRIILDYMGPIVAKSNVVAMVPKIELLETGVHSKYNHRLWVYAMKFLAKSKERQIMIVREVFKDLRAGHKGIIIPIDFLAHGKELVDMINRQARVNNKKRGENWDEETAILYTGAIKSEEEKDRIIDGFDRGKHKVLVSIRRMIKQGVDMASPTALYAVIPMSASAEIDPEGDKIGAPLMQQLGYRISTFVEGKQQPVIKLFVDGIGQSFGCFKSLFWHEIFPKLRHSKEKPARYKMDTADFQRAMYLAGLKEYFPENQPGVRVYSKDLMQKERKEAKKKVAIGGFSALKPRWRT